MPQLTLVPLPVRQVIYAAEAPIETVYFPEEGMLSMVANLEEGVQAEVGMIGREGVAGGGVVRGVSTSFNECFVQMPGSALRMGAGAFRRAGEDGISLSQEFLAMMLGVHRPSVTVTAGILQGGGRVTILDRAGFEASACECYRTVQRRAEQVMG